MVNTVRNLTNVAVVVPAQGQLIFCFLADIDIFLLLYIVKLLFLLFIVTSMWLLEPR